MQRVLLVSLFLATFLANSADTVLKLYRPFGEVTEQIVPIVKNQLVGSCQGQSQLIVREDAWRCTAAGKSYDPCFAQLSNNKHQLICPQSPWVGDSVAIEVATPLNNASHETLDMSRVLPWGIELANGEHCKAVSSNEIYDDMPVRYQCSNQNVLVGYLQRCKSVWSMLEKTPDGVVTMDLSKAWF